MVVWHSPCKSRTLPGASNENPRRKTGVFYLLHCLWPAQSNRAAHCPCVLRKARENRATDTSGIESAFFEQLLTRRVLEECVRQSELQDRQFNAICRQQLRHGRPRTTRDDIVFQRDECIVAAREFQHQR